MVRKAVVSDKQDLSTIGESATERVEHFPKFFHKDKHSLSLGGIAIADLYT